VVIVFYVPDEGVTPELCCGSKSGMTWPAPPPADDKPLRLFAKPGLESILCIPLDNCDPLAALRIVSSSSGVGGRGRPGPLRCWSSRSGLGTGSLTWRVPSFWTTSSSSSSSSLVSSSSTIGGGWGWAIRILPFGAPPGVDDMKLFSSSPTKTTNKIAPSAILFSLV